MKTQDGACELKQLTGRPSSASALERNSGHVILELCPVLSLLVLGL